jgi:hypothetical protein
MGTIKTTNIQTITGSGTLTLGTSGETIQFGSGVTNNLMYPAFEAYLSANQSVSDNTLVKAQLDTEVLDTDSCYDNSTNYRFTPTVAGKYFVYGSISGSKLASAATVQVRAAIFKNGSIYAQTDNNFSGNNIYLNTPFVAAIIDMNGSSDYLELYGESDSSDGSGQIFVSGTKNTRFGAYRIGS